MIEKFTKDRLALWGMILGFAFILPFILWVGFAWTSTALNLLFMLLCFAWWLACIFIGILTIIMSIQENSKTWETPRVLLLCAGIAMIVFPFVGAILFLVIKLTNPSAISSHK